MNWRDNIFPPPRYDGGVTGYFVKPEHKKTRALLVDIDARLMEPCKKIKFARDIPLRPYLYEALDMSDAEFKEIQPIVHQKTTE